MGVERGRGRGGAGDCLEEQVHPGDGAVRAFLHVHRRREADELVEIGRKGRAIVAGGGDGQTPGLQELLTVTEIRSGWSQREDVIRDRAEREDVAGERRPGRVLDELGRAVEDGGIDREGGEVLSPVRAVLVRGELEVVQPDLRRAGG